MRRTRRRRLVAAPDKFRSTASASEAAAAIGRGAELAGWDATRLPMADGGEGLLDALGGDERVVVVTGPLGRPVRARWHLVEEHTSPTAVVEAAEAVGLGLAGGPEGNEPLTASTTGVGELILAAVDAGAVTVLVGCGGSATTDGGAGAVAAIGDPARLSHVRLTVACDVRTRFLDAARVFAPQKGAGAQDVAMLSERLSFLAEDYHRRFGVDVTRLDGSAAAGGLAGGLAALGAELTSGFDVVAERQGVRPALTGADLLVTGEGRLDATSFDGKVVGSLAALAGTVPVLCVAGQVEEGAALRWVQGADVTLVDLTRRFGAPRARSETTSLITEVVVEFLVAR